MTSNLENVYSTYGGKSRECWAEDTMNTSGDVQYTMIQLGISRVHWGCSVHWMGS